MVLQKGFPRASAVAARVMYGDLHSVPPPLLHKFCHGFDNLHTGMGFKMDCVAVALYKTQGDEQQALDLCVNAS